MQFEPYPFEKLKTLLGGITPSQEICDLTIGEPQFDTPEFIQKALRDNSSSLKKYPKTLGEEFLRSSMRSFVKSRFDITLDVGELLPSFGTREILFNFPQFLLRDIDNPTIAYTNPFYQIYEGAAIMCGAKIIHINLNIKNNFKAEIGDYLKNCDLVILNFPNNPTGASLSLKELSLWVEASLKYDFVLLNDECYSEIYSNTKPISLLEACKNVGNLSFKNNLVINSLSKRSSSPGVRSGFIAGDKNILNLYKVYRTYVGTAVPLPLQHAASVAWSDFGHAEEIRLKYKKNLELANEILGIDVSDATFYLWLKVDDDLEFTKSLYKNKGIKVLPGSFLGREEEGKGYIRIALIDEPTIIKEALIRLKEFLDNE
ncbi:MAG: N-succinyl-L,L-diaminopimelate aminotransferase alternative (EC [uncultured Campylobacterales bacterium]|uniref:N-succinyl-L,L-diaminopimelate aminotransferase alternative (EC) n=1 Tax=uncultured Campylobacterales bacterium TaxID=352960 RepID=A0A6S6TAP5_9BACT|nr:MAG: N-succinyl-L,L-diaminopimelate aminotransferase alternative (EC [uncultured Campylobacterales bacterium]